MDMLLHLINAQIDNPQQARFVFVLLVGLAALLLGGSLMVLISSSSNPFRQRLQVLNNQVRRPSNPSGFSGWELPGIFNGFAGLLMPRKRRVQSQVRKKLIMAGYRSVNALKTLYALKFLLMVSFFLIGLYASAQLPEASSQQVLLIAWIAAMVGFLLPSIVLDKRAARRVRVLRTSFPDALDMLVVCVESGLGLNGALVRVAQELDVSHPELAEELALVNREVRAGVNRVDALKAMADRCGVEDIRGLVALIDQSVRLGGSIGHTLRIYSEEFRDRRMQQAEEEAAKIGTQMLFPLTFCLWPSFFVVAVGPAVLKVIEVFSN